MAKLFTDMGSLDDEAKSVTVQVDGKIVVTGFSFYNDRNHQYVLARYNPDGSVDHTFDNDNGLNNITSYTENSAAIVLNITARVWYPELGFSYYSSYLGASITLARHGGANVEDVFSGSGNLSFDGSNALLSGVNIGTVSNSNGSLTLTFNGNAKQNEVNKTLFSLAYQNTSDTPPISVNIDWTFNDGNTGWQGTGGGLSVVGNTTINIKALPDFSSPAITVAYTDTAFVDNFVSTGTNQTGNLAATGADTIAYGIAGGMDNGNGTILNGMLAVNTTSGAYSFTPNSAFIESLGANPTDSATFNVTASDGLQLVSQVFTVRVTQQGATETNGDNTFKGVTPNSVDHWAGLQGNDVYYVDNVGDVVTENIGEGWGNVYSTISYSLAANVDALILMGTANLDGTGNGDLNGLVGNAGNNVLDGGAGADTLIGGVGADIINLTETVAATDTIRIAAGDSLVSGFDTVYGFKLGASSISTTGIDQLDLDNTFVSANTTATNGGDSTLGSIKSHSISAGIIRFDNADSFDAATPLTINMSNATVAFVSVSVSEGNTFVFQDNVVNDILVELVGVTASSLNNTGLNARAVWIV